MYIYMYSYFLSSLFLSPLFSRPLLLYKLSHTSPAISPYIRTTSAHSAHNILEFETGAFFEEDVVLFLRLLRVI